MDYSEVIEFVKKTASEKKESDKYPFRNSYDHTMRVYRWAIRLQAKLGGDLDVIVLAALLHDVGHEDGRLSEDDWKDDDKVKDVEIKVPAPAAG